VYDTDVSRNLVSTVLDKIVPDLRAWQARPLDPGVSRDEVLGDDPDRVRDRDLALPGNAAAGDAGVLAGQIVLAARPADRSSSLDQHRFEPFVAMAGTGRA